VPVLRLQRDHLALGAAHGNVRRRLEREFEFVRAERLGARAVRQYHWGGGTPTQLSLELMQRVHDCVRAHVHARDDAEVADRSRSARHDA
jgi:coproporphyrinogen III oxidase-like Fe-S oxidoreductase